MVVLKDICFEIFKLLGAERTTVMSANCLLNAAFAVDMAAPGDVAIADWTATNLTLKLCFELFDWYFEGGRELLLLHDDDYIAF